MVIENNKLKLQMKYLPMEQIDWKKDIKPYYKKLGGLLRLYNFQLAPDETTIKEFLEKSIFFGNVFPSNLSNEEVMFISDLYYFIIHWQKDIGFNLSKTSVYWRHFKDWCTIIGVAVIDIGVIIGTICLVAVVIKAILQ
jgi:hypothetical protein